MSKEAKTKNIYQKLLSIQQHIIGLGKDKAAYGYKYVTGDKVMEHIKPLMNDLGLLLKQEVISIENTRQDYQTKGGSTSEINSKVMMRFTWVDVETGEKDENLFGANGQNAWDKGVGSALTYGERYFLLKYFHIATDEDDIDNPESKNPVVVPIQEVKPELASEAFRAALVNNLQAFGGLYEKTDYDRLNAAAKVLTKDKAKPFKEALINGLLKKIKDQRPNLNHTATETQLDLLDKTLLSHHFTVDEKEAFATVGYEYTKEDAQTRIDWLLNEIKARTQSEKAAA